MRVTTLENAQKDTDFALVLRSYYENDFSPAGFLLFETAFPDVHTGRGGNIAG